MIWYKYMRSLIVWSCKYKSKSMYFLHFFTSSLFEAVNVFFFWCGVQHIFKMTRHHVIIPYRYPQIHHYAIMWLPLGGRNCVIFFFPQDFGFSYVHLYNSKSQHNYINPEVQTAVQSNNGVQNNKRENSKARLFWQFEPHVIMKIGVLQYISAFERSLKCSVCMSLLIPHYMSMCTICAHLL